MKKIEIIKDCDPNAQKMTLIELEQAIKNPRQLVVARDANEALCLVVFDGADYTLTDNDGDVEAEYTNLSFLANDYDLFLV